MRTVFLIAFLAHSCTADEVKTSLSDSSWPDKSGDAFVFSALELEDNAETIARPSRTDYPELYSDYEVRFVKEIPKPEGAKLVEMFALEAPSSTEGMLRWIPGFDAESPIFKSMKLGMKRASTAWGKQFPLMVHTGVGYLFRDEHNNELGRIAISFWAVSNDKADKHPYYKNRAVVAYTKCKGDWEGGYYSRAKKVKDLSLTEWDGAVSYMKSYAQRFPFYSGTALLTQTGKVINRARTCNTFVEECTKTIANVDTMKSNLVRIGYTVAVVSDDQTQRVSAAELESALKTPNPARQVVPSWWNAKGELDSHREKPSSFFVVTTPLRGNPQNYLNIYADTIRDMWSGRRRSMR